MAYLLATTSQFVLVVSNIESYYSAMFSWLKRTPKGPAATIVMKRAIILKHIFVRALANPPTEQLVEWMSHWTQEEGQRFAVYAQEQSASQIGKLQAGGLWDDLSESERRFLQSDVTGISEQARIEASWLAESIVCLFWALGSIPELPKYDEQASPDLFRALPKGTHVNEFINEAHLRPLHEIERQRGLSELWHWRCRTKQLIESGQMKPVLEDGTVIDDVIAMAASKAVEQGDLMTVIGGDFPAFGKPFRDLSLQEFATVISIAQERHRTLNWLCGYAPGNRWAETPTDT